MRGTYQIIASLLLTWLAFVVNPADVQAERFLRIHSPRRPFSPLFRPHCAERPPQRLPYPYGHFGADRRTHAGLHRGYYQHYLQWTIR